jgi:hypothetical protein
MERIEGKGGQPCRKGKYPFPRRVRIGTGELSTKFVKKLWKSFG